MVYGGSLLPAAADRQLDNGLPLPLNWLAHVHPATIPRYYSIRVYHYHTAQCFHLFGSSFDWQPVVPLPHCLPPLSAH